jgi:AcrR family transcriptional regulator
MIAYWAEGPDAVSLNELCRRASVSKPSVYREFDGEDKLMDAALQRYAETVLAPSLDAIDPDGPLHATLERMITSFTTPDQTRPPGCLLARLQQVDGLGPVVSERIENLRDQARVGYARLVDSAKARGDISHDISTDVAAAMIDIQGNTVLTRMAAGENPALLKDQAMLAFSVFA